MSLEPWHLVIRHPDYVLASWRRIFCVIWRRETTEAGARHLSEACKEFAKQHPGGIGLLTLIESGAPLPAPAARKMIARFLSEMSTSIRCSVVVVEGSGFRAAAVRSVVTGLAVLARPRYPHRVCDIREAERLLAEMLPGAAGAGVDDGTFRASLDALRASVDSP